MPDRILCIGDSITYARALAPGNNWDNPRGMAASADDLDWFSLYRDRHNADLKAPDRDGLSTFVTAADPAILNQYNTWIEGVDANRRVVIIQISEHYYADTLGLQTDEEINTWHATVHTWTAARRARVIQVSKWASDAPGQWSPDTGTGYINLKTQALCSQYGDHYCDISELCGQPENLSSEENQPEGAYYDGFHPSDTGMANLCVLITAGVEAARSGTYRRQF